VTEHSEQAFTAIVTRYTDMVYSACLRQLKNPHRAEDATQAVFITLARKAPKLTKGTVLAGSALRTKRAAGQREELRKIVRLSGRKCPVCVVKQIGN